MIKMSKIEHVDIKEGEEFALPPGAKARNYERIPSVVEGERDTIRITYSIQTGRKPLNEG